MEAEIYNSLLLIQYVVLVVMGVGMCFCLKRANRLIPNRFNFPLVDRSARREGFHHLGAEEEGLLSHYSDVEDEDDAEVIDNQNALRISRRSDEEEEEEEEDFGHLQSHDAAAAAAATAIGSDSEDETGSVNKKPYKDDAHHNPQ
ncbi:unnamed protein product [Mucor fragilis]